MIDQVVPTPLQRYQRLIELSRDLASTLDLDILLQRIVNAGAELTGAEASSILLYDGNKNQLFFQVSTNLETPLMRGLAVPVEGSIAGWIVTNEKPLIVNDAKNDPRFYDNIQNQTSFETHSLLGAPLIAKDKCVGVVEVVNKKHGTFTKEDQDILMTLGAQAAVAIENAHLFSQSDLIAEMIHEIRTPLGSLNAATHLLLRPDISQEQVQKMVHIIQSETKRLSEMATSFLDLARLESGRSQFRVQEIDPVTLLEECVGISRERMIQKDIHFTWQVPEKLPHIIGDRDKIKQVILNLFSNAIKYNSKEGKITLTAGVDGDYFNFSVLDTGKGIPTEAMDNLFEKFFRVPGSEKLAEGTGLGLSICKKIVESHGGHIEVESEVDVGTTFSVHLPLKQKF